MAKHFKFRLETVLKERKRQEEKKLQDWNLARAILQQMIDAKIEMQDKLKISIGEATTLAQKIQTASQMSVMDQYIVGLKAKIERKGKEIERGQKLTEKKRLEYVEASKKTKVLEKLKEKQQDDYENALKKKEEKNLADIYVLRSSVKGSASW